MKHIALVFLGVLLLPAGLLGADPAADGGQASDQTIQARIDALTAAGLAPEMARKTVQAMIRSNFSPEQTEAVQQAMRTAHLQGLPSWALAAKLFEGLAKQAPPAMTVQAVARVAERYGYAYSAARRLASNDRQRIFLGDIMVSGLAAGLTRENMNRVVDLLESRIHQIDTEPATKLAQETLLIARDMARQGVGPHDVVEAISQALTQGLSSDTLRQARQAMASQRSVAPPEALARGYARALGQTGHADIGAHGGSQSPAGGQSAGASDSGGASSGGGPGGDSGGGSEGSSGGGGGGGGR